MEQRFQHLHIRLVIMCFLQFFSWGAWLITLGRYLLNTLNFSGSDVGSAFATAGIASIIMPPLLGFVVDRWVNAEHVLSGAMFLSGLGLIAIGLVPNGTPFWVFLLLILWVNLFYMPTLSLTNSIAYSTLKHNGEDVVKAFPPIRVWGTIGFIIAMWLINLLGFMDSPKQFFIAGGASIALALYALTLPASKPAGKNSSKRSVLSLLGLDAFVLFKQRKMALFFIFSMLLGCTLQLTNMFGSPFLDSFKHIPEYANSFAVKNSNILLSISQISETLFILLIPFFLHRFGIKWVIFASFMAWVLRFGLFAVGNPAFPGIIALILSMIVYGMAFDFFNISGSIFVENEAPTTMRAGAQGVFVFMTNGLGTIIGSRGGGYIVDFFNVESNASHWPYVWYTFAAYALVVGLLFVLLFNNKKQPAQTKQSL